MEADLQLLRFRRKMTTQSTKSTILHEVMALFMAFKGSVLLPTLPRMSYSQSLLLLLQKGHSSVRKHYQYKVKP